MFSVMSKTKMINVRLTDQTHEDFRIAAELRGASMSSLLHQFVVRTIREEKEREPKAFEKKPEISGKVNPVGAAEFPKLKNVKDFPAIRTKKELEEKIRELGIRPETVGVVGDFKDYTPEQFLDFYLDIKEQRDLAQKQIDNREKIKKQKIS